MKALAILFSTFALMILQLGVTYLNFTLGWGLQVQSWTAIGFCFLATMILTMAQFVVAAAGKD